MIQNQNISKRRRNKRLSGAYRNSASGELFHAAAMGGLLAGALVLSGGSPYWYRHLLKNSNRGEEQKRKLRLRQAMKRLERRKLIHLTSQENGIRLHLTPEGKNLYRHFALKTFNFSKPKHWDGKWRIVLFDIPEEHRKTRQALQKTLRNAGCFPLQKSVLVTPVSCRHEIEELASLFGNPNTLLYCETASLGKAEPGVRKFFGMH